MAKEIRNEESPGFGTFEAIDTLEEDLFGQKDRLPEYEVIMINVQTLIRNRARKDISKNELLKEVHEDMDEISSRLTDGFDRMNAAADNNLLLYYTTDYVRILGKNHSRPTPPSKQIYFRACADVNRLMKKSVERKGRNLVVRQISIRPNRRYYRALIRAAQETTMSKEAVMLSHAYPDYHASQRIPVNIVESFTGNILRPRDFGVKIFADSAIPFFPETHILLGDRNHVQPMVVRNRKNEVLETAEHENWRHKSRSVVAESIYKHGWLNRTVNYPLT